jgi:carbon storage regulator CsrA
MLVLSRRPEEKVLLPTVPALIKVLSAQAGLVRLGFEAPASVPVLREELMRGERLRPPGGRPDEVPSPDVPLSNLLLGLTLLRVQLADCDPAVKRTLDGIEAELEALRAAIEARAEAVPVG